MTDTTHATHDARSLAHPVPLWLLLATFAALIVLTFLTVAATWIDLGMWNIWVALLIAVIKGVLVALFFMHLWWDSRFNGVILIAALFILAIFIGIAVLDSREYSPNYAPPARGVAAP